MAGGSTSPFAIYCKIFILSWSYALPALGDGAGFVSWKIEMANNARLRRSGNRNLKSLERKNILFWV
jgi:hypothetical protein